MGDRDLHRARGRLPFRSCRSSAIPPSRASERVDLRRLPGATPQTMNDSVVSLIERGLSGVKHLLYFESSTTTRRAPRRSPSRSRRHRTPARRRSDVQNQPAHRGARLPQVRQIGVQPVEAAEQQLPASSARCARVTAPPQRRRRWATTSRSHMLEDPARACRASAARSSQLGCACDPDPARSRRAQPRTHTAGRRRHTRSARRTPRSPRVSVGEPPAVAGQQRRRARHRVQGHENVGEFGTSSCAPSPRLDVRLGDVARVELGRPELRRLHPSEWRARAGLGGRSSRRGANALADLADAVKSGSPNWRCFPAGIACGCPTTPRPSCGSRSRRW